MALRARRRRGRLLLIYAGLAPFVVAAVFPIFWMAITAFKEEADFYRMDLVPFWFHSAPTLKNFRILFTHSYFPVWFVNTMLLSICLVTITLLTAVPAAYALSRLRLPGGHNLGIAMFMTYLVPPISTASGPPGASRMIVNKMIETPTSMRTAKATRLRM